MAETFLQNAQLTGLDRAARRTEILRAKETAALTDRVATNETDIAEQTGRMSCFLSRTSGQSILNNTGTMIQWDHEAFDVGGLHDNSTNNTRITIPTGGGGLWATGFSISWGGSSAGTYRAAQVIFNGVQSRWICAAEGPPMNFVGVAASGIHRLVDGDYLECRTQQDSGAALSIRANDTVTYISNFWAYRLGD